MNLDDLPAFAKLDAENMIGEIDRLPDQLNEAWELGQTLIIPQIKTLKAVIISGMGGSAIAADLLAAYAGPFGTVPIVVHRDYDLPHWANGPDVLVVVSSHSGNTEETLSSFERAKLRGCEIIAITTGGKLADLAKEAEIPIWRFEHAGQPRAAVGYSFGLLLALMDRLGVVPDPHYDLEKTINSMLQQQEALRLGSPVAQNPAKRLAGQLNGRYVSVFGSDFLAPVARRWKTQINEIAKAWAQFEFIPEADHNTLAGLLNPENLIDKIMCLFLMAPSDNQRNNLRLELTRKGFMQEGLNTDVFHAAGDVPLAHMWTTLHFGDYLAYFLAMSYGVDPTPVEALQNLKAEMAKEPKPFQT